MSNRYIVTITQEVYVPVVVEAATPEDAREAVYLQLGEAGDPSYGEYVISSVKPTES